MKKKTKLISQAWDLWAIYEPDVYTIFDCVQIMVVHYENISK